MLHHLIAGITIGRGDGRGYLDAMERELGVAGRLLGLGVLDNLLPLLWETQPERFPLTGVVLDHARGLIVHSRYVARTARARPATAGGSGGSRTRPGRSSRIAPAADVGGDPLIGCFGNLNMNKRIPQLLEAFALAAPQRGPARGCCSSAPPASASTSTAASSGSGSAEGVERLDYVPEERMWSLMAACDVLVNLRSPTMGETSGSVIRALSLGKPMLVSDVGWFAELPDDVVLKIPVDEYEVRDDRGALELAADHGATLGAAARAYVEREHDLDRVADAYVAALEAAAGGDAVDDAVLWRIAEAAAEVGIDDARRARPRRRRRRARRRDVAARARALAVPAWLWLAAIVVRLDRRARSRSRAGWSRRGS